MKPFAGPLSTIYIAIFLTAFTWIDSRPLQLAGEEAQTVYQCLPCGSSCDKKTYTAPGNCSHCYMPLVTKSSVTFRSIAPAEICEFIRKNPEAILLDVRTKAEFEGKADPNFGTLKGAINIPVQELEKSLASISHLKNKQVLVFCSHSHRSPRASYLLTQHGFINVTNMDGGMSQVTDTACKR
jgi:rhodanese-related sulfurtransferase/DNA-directed RNA polymerase subunit RPC12/RpoP